MEPDSSNRAVCISTVDIDVEMPTKTIENFDESWCRACSEMEGDLFFLLSSSSNALHFRTGTQKLVGVISSDSDWTPSEKQSKAEFLGNRFLDMEELQVADGMLTWLLMHHSSSVSLKIN
jgi:hypothetical protein